MSDEEPRADERASLHGLTPEEAPHALLAVNPDDPPAGEGYDPSEDESPEE